jgi:hypothetical protein
MKKWFSAAGLAERIGVVFGATYLLVGALGFVVTRGVGFAATDGKDLVLFAVNPLHNVLHIAIGAVLVAAALDRRSALMNTLIGGTYFLVGIVGTIVVELDTNLFDGLLQTRSDLNILALNHPDNLLHFSSSAVLIASALLARRAVIKARNGVAVEPATTNPVVLEAVPPRPASKAKPRATSKSKAAVRPSASAAARKSTASRGSRQTASRRRSS